MHPNGEEIYVVVTGLARFYLGDAMHDMESPSAVYVAPGTPHWPRTSATAISNCIS